jgi:peptidoglycan/LPS O-acetylase OafA/YrhL
VPGFARSHLPGMHALTAVLGMGWTGVDLFFVLSGLLIGGILIDHRQDPNLYAVFYARRALRILPLYALVLAPFLLGSDQPKIPLLTFTQNISWSIAGTWGPQWVGATWSLAVEEQFYLILPAMIRCIPPARLPHVALLLIVAAPLARVLAWFSFGNAYACYMLMPCRMDALFAGVLLAWMLRNRRLRDGLLQRAWPVRAAICLSGGGYALLLATGGDALSPLLWSFGYSVVAVFYAALILEIVLRPKIAGTRPVMTRAVGMMAAMMMMIDLLSWFGLRAYGIYLLHWPVESIVEHLLATGLLGLVIASLLTLLAAAASWRFIELPCIAFSHRGFRYEKIAGVARLAALEQAPAE